MRFLFLFLILVFFSLPASAVEPDEMLKDRRLEMRARHISQHLRCLVCQGEAIDDSNADFAKDLRRLVRERLAAGDTDEDVLRFLQTRYGDFILLQPPVTGKTMLLWLTPLVVLGGGLILMRQLVRAGR